MRRITRTLLLTLALCASARAGIIHMDKSDPPPPPPPAEEPARNAADDDADQSLLDYLLDLITP